MFVPRALRGERWRVRILKVSKSAVYARGEELLEASPERIEPKCESFGICGGCDLLHMSYDEELRFKLKHCNDALERIGGVDFRISEIVPAEQTENYRCKNICAVGGTTGTVNLGFYRKRSHQIVPSNNCEIQSLFAQKAAETVRVWLGKSKKAPYDESTGRGTLRHIWTRVSASSGEGQLVLVTARGLGDTSELLSELRRNCPELKSLLLCVNKSRGNTVLNGELYTLWGSDTISERLCGFDFELSPRSFFQVNPPQAERLYELARGYAGLSKNETALDLYCGAGTITLCLSRDAGRVIGAEIVSDAVSDARENARRNEVQNAEFMEADAAEAARKLEVPIDVVVVDPPRRGLAESVITDIAEISPKRVVYISCNPGTLARDLGRFEQLGYRVTAGTCVDMFPRCADLETVVLLESTDK